MKQIFILAHDIARKRALQALADAPEGYRVTIEPPKRSGGQNDIFHALCNDIARDCEWMGKRWPADAWKVLLVSGHAVATKQGAEVIPGLEGEFVNMRESTARMSKTRATSLIEYAQAFLEQNREE